LKAPWRSTYPVCGLKGRTEPFTQETDFFKKLWGEKNCYPAKFQDKR